MSYRKGDVVEVEKCDGTTSIGILISWRSRFGGYYNIMFDGLGSDYRQVESKIKKLDIPNAFDLIKKKPQEGS